MSDDKNLHVYALIAGEASGDTLGAGLMSAIRQKDPEASFIGIGGPKMIACGMVSSVNYEELSVMGLTEVMFRLPKILKIRSSIVKTIVKSRPRVLIGIDLPDFNLYVESKVKAEGIPTVHYVSPSVWAWREKRVEKIRRACDEVLALLPFEKAWYEKHDMSCTYVGHTLANSIPISIDQAQSRERIALYKNSVDKISGKVMGILPGSRKGVIQKMLPIYAHTARIIRRKLPETVFVCSVTDYKLASLIKDIWLEVAPDLSLTVYVGSTQDVIASCDAVLLTCGTIALETMLLKTPFTVAYKVSAISAFIARRMLKVDVFSLPNLITGRKVVKEYIQDECTPQALAEEMYKLLVYDNILMKKEFEIIHRSMILNSDELACEAVFKVIDRVEKKAHATPLSFKTDLSSPQSGNEDKKSEGKPLDSSIHSSLTIDGRQEPSFGEQSKGTSRLFSADVSSNLNKK